MKINYESNSSERMYQAGNVIRNSYEDLYLIANNPEGKLFVVNLRKSYSSHANSYIFSAR